MKIAFTGASSTGKTTLARALNSSPTTRHVIPVFLPSKGRRLMDFFGGKEFDELTKSECREYRLMCLASKAGEEAVRRDFITDRSFIDLAAYWIEHDTVGESAELQSFLTGPCRRLSALYDYHFFFPYGIIPAETGGRRSSDEGMQKRVGDRILQLLTEWGIRYTEVEVQNLDQRVGLVTERLLALCG